MYFSNLTCNPEHAYAAGFSGAPKLYSTRAKLPIGFGTLNLTGGKFDSELTKGRNG